MRSNMMLNKFMLFFWITMVLFMILLGYVNFVTGNMFLFVINAATAVLASFNAQWTYKSIKK
jgi:hypothetical protein